MSASVVVSDVTLSFGGIRPLDRVSFEAGTGRLTAVIGPNGAGKTSLFNCLSGIYHPSAGRILIGGNEVLGKGPAHIARMGLARTFQTPALFEGLTVAENLLAGRYRFGKGGLVESALRLPRVRRSEVEQRAYVERIASLVGVESEMDRQVTSLSYGVAKKVEFARALCQAPELLLLDEPMAGMTHEEKRELSQAIVQAQDELGMTVLLVEHDMGVVMDLADHIVVLNFGRKIAEGTPDEIRRNELVISAYLGEDLERQVDIATGTP